MEIVKAQKEDLKAIMKIKNEALALFKMLNDPQWTEEYPSENEFISDIERGELYVAKESECILGFAVLSFNVHDEEYAPLIFSSLKDSLTFCRFAVSEKVRGKGVASTLLKYALEYAKEKGKRYIITDTHETNVVMQKFLIKNGFYQVDTLSFLGTDGTFLAFEKKV